MPVYRFEVRTETHVLLTEGVELADTGAARVEAARRIGQLLHVYAGQVWTDEIWQMDVTDGTGLILYALTVSAVRAPATAGSRPNSH